MGQSGAKTSSVNGIRRNPKGSRSQGSQLTIWTRIFRVFVWLPECNSIRTHRTAEPEVRFRIVHLSLDAPNGLAIAPYRNQTVEIAVGPKMVFETGTIGTLTRQIPTDRVVNAVLPFSAKPTRETAGPRLLRD